MFFPNYFSQVYARMMRTAKVMNSATMPEAPVCPAVRVESVAHGTPCVAQETAAAMVSWGILSDIHDYNHISVKLLIIFYYLWIACMYSYCPMSLHIYSVILNWKARKLWLYIYSDKDFKTICLDLSRCLPSKWHRWYRCIHHPQLAQTQQHLGASCKEASHCSRPSAFYSQRWGLIVDLTC